MKFESYEGEEGDWGVGAQYNIMLKWLQCSPMSAPPAPRQMRVKLRTQVRRRLPQPDTTIAGSRKFISRVIKKAESCSARKSPLSGRKVGSRGSSADEMSA
ncbi:unnamed protein product [Toxocara canis]|uniref:Uncharacterized protein n=1 Tax=Toxocara canis TaxID=6265 RepID=A0A183U6T9_TOXCA|nr:unnamed protein product [Toxocara canis]